MNTYKITLMATAVVLSACNQPKQEQSENTQTQEQQEEAPVTLKLKWETDAVLTTCESVLHDDKNDVSPNRFGIR